jgi:hypothetical protein
MPMSDLTTNHITAAVRTTRQNCAALAERLLALGRGDEIPSMILRGIAPDRIPPHADPVPPTPSLPTRTVKPRAGAGFDPEVSKARLAQQMGKAPP